MRCYTGNCEEISKNTWFGFIGCVQMHWLHIYGLSSTRKQKKDNNLLDISIQVCMKKKWVQCNSAIK